jgi:NADPH:quinone reductase-like Zn-dependent oxidoreductase
MGQDFAGEVAERGKDVLSFNTGDRVFGFGQGSYAEYVAAPASTVALMPKSMVFEVGAALPTLGVTALQLVRDVVRVKAGMTILIHGAAGSVGSFTT